MQTLERDAINQAAIKIIKPLEGVRTLKRAGDSRRAMGWAVLSFVWKVQVPWRVRGGWDGGERSSRG